MMIHNALRCTRRTRPVFHRMYGPSKNASHLTCWMGQPLAVRAESSSVLREVPGPPKQPVVGNIFNFPIKELIDGLPDVRLKYYEQYGGIFRVNMVGTDLVWVKDLTIMQEILKSPGVSNSDPFRDAFGYFFPNSMIVLEGQAWQRVRKIGQKALQKHKLDRFLPQIDAMCKRAVEHRLMPSIQNKDVSVDLHRIMAEFTFDSFHMFAYNKDFTALTGGNKELLDCCIDISAGMRFRMNMPIKILWKIPVPANRRTDAAKKVLQKKVKELLVERMEGIAAGVEDVSLLDNFIVANAEEIDEKSRITEDEILDQIGTFFFGAFDTTSNTLAMALNHLAMHPEVQDDLAASLADIDLSQITVQELNELTLLGAVIDETNRFSPTAQLFPRSLRQDLILSNGIQLKKGTQCVLDWSINGRDPVNWPGQTAEDLGKWRPSRWMESKPKKMAHLPFGHGTRICIGSQLALVEMKMGIACLVKNLRFAPDPKRPMGYKTKLAFGPADGTWQHVSLRT